jgi:VWFA-related protein
MNHQRPSPLATSQRNATAFRLAPFFSLVTLLFLASPHALAQTPPASADDEIVETVRTDLVLVQLYATDARGRRISGLAAKYVQVRDNGRPVEVVYFQPASARVALIFALDASGSIRDLLARQRETALALLARFGVGSRAAVVTFADEPALALPFTNDAASVRAAFQLDAQPNRHTAIFDAALACVRAFDAKELRGDERRIVVLVSDGLDNVSRARASNVIAEANARDVSFYVVHLPLFAPDGNHLAPRRPARGFRDLAERTGGAYFMLGDSAHALDPNYNYDLAPVFSAIADDLHSQYELGFYPDAAARQEPQHKLDFKLVGDKSKLRINARRDTYTLKR